MANNYLRAPVGMSRLSARHDLEVAPDSPDIRGWNVATHDERTIGIVDDLIVDTTVMRARYLVVDVRPTDRTTDTGEDVRQILVPVAHAWVNSAEHLVRLDVTGPTIDAMPQFTGTVPIGYDESYPHVAPAAPPLPR